MKLGKVVCCMFFFFALLGVDPSQNMATKKQKGCYITCVLIQLNQQKKRGGE